MNNQQRNAIHKVINTPMFRQYIGTNSVDSKIRPILLLVVS